MGDSRLKIVKKIVWLQTAGSIIKKFIENSSSVGMVPDSSAIGSRFKPGSSLSISENLISRACFCCKSILLLI